MSWLIAIALGILAGLHTSTWGMYKDCPHEGFSWSRYFRSTGLSTVLSLPAFYFSGLDVTTASGAAVLFGLIYVLERAVVEFYKTFVREEDQTKYFIPMQFHVRGRVIRSSGLRLLAGAVCILAVAGVIAAVFWADAKRSSLTTLEMLLIGSVGGWISAFGGAWKDAPIEGFETLKFLRSPALAAAYAWLMCQYTDHLALIAFPALGYTIATLETYKTFFFPRRPRGKFRGKPVHFPGNLRWRHRFVPLYVLIWIVVIGLNVQALEPALEVCT